VKQIKRLILKAQTQKSGGRVLRRIIVHEQKTAPCWKQEAGYMIQPYYNEGGRITTEAIVKATKQEAKQELKRLELEFPKVTDYHVIYISEEMVMHMKDQQEHGKDWQEVEFPAAMIRRAERLLDAKQ
jgi:hypothetical protein